MIEVEEHSDNANSLSSLIVKIYVIVMDTILLRLVVLEQLEVFRIISRDSSQLKV